MSSKDGSGNTMGTPYFNPLPVRIVVAETTNPDSTSQVFRVYTGIKIDSADAGMRFVTTKCLSLRDVFLEFRTESGHRTFEAATVIAVNETANGEYCCQVAFVRDHCKVDRNWID